ncbi:hypothetical protein [Cellvibrio sp. OA-2007]|uniref:hypothetical protein n=1 Tax=Cellvibrio sp. OA-2007 TaxID=529823 RepID=UPI0007836889|nr:hypothetical protein [Cellvibrio sp. OA-2007]
MSWNSNNTAHAALYSFEKWNHNVKRKNFETVGNWSTDFLIGFVAGDSATVRQEKVESHARKLDQVFTALFGAVYSNGFKRISAISSMESILNDQGKTLADLGDPVDEAYKFRGEL